MCCDLVVSLSGLLLQFIRNSLKMLEYGVVGSESLISKSLELIMNLTTWAFCGKFCSDEGSNKSNVLGTSVN